MDEIFHLHQHLIKLGLYWNRKLIYRMWMEEATELPMTKGYLVLFSSGFHSKGLFKLEFSFVHFITPRLLFDWSESVPDEYRRVFPPISQSIMYNAFRIMELPVTSPRPSKPLSFVDHIIIFVTSNNLVDMIFTNWQELLLLLWDTLIQA